MCSCMGSTLNPFSGAYRYICEKYDLNFYTFSRENTFDKVCKVAIKELKDKIEGDDQKIFDYVFVDESQDFPKSFIELINLVTKNKFILLVMFFRIYLIILIIIL